MDNKNTECDVCREPANDLHRMPCGHHLCTVCTDKCSVCADASGEEAIGAEECRCPIFSKAQGITDDVNNELPVEELVETAASVSVRDCSVCLKKDVCTYCVDCDQNYCSECSDVHSKIPSSMSHVVEHIGGNTADESYTEHESTDGVVYCKKCNEIVTLEKFLFHHSQHKMMLCDDYIKWRKLSLDEQMAAMNSGVAEVERCFCKINLELFKAELLKNETKEMVDQRARTMKDAVDKIAKEFHNEIDQELISYQKKATTLETQLDKMKQQFEDGITLLKNEMRNLDLKPLIPSPIETGLETLQRFPFFLQPYNVSFAPNTYEPIIERKSFGSSNVEFSAFFSAVGGIKEGNQNGFKAPVVSITHEPVTVGKAVGSSAGATNEVDKGTISYKPTNDGKAFEFSNRDFGTSLFADAVTRKLKSPLKKTDTKVMLK